MDNRRMWELIRDNLFEVAMATPRVATAKVAAALVYKGKVISYGVNSKKSSPFQKKYSSNEHAIYTHAEVAAIKNALRNFTVDDIRRMTMIVCRVKWLESAGIWGVGLAKPCIGCQGAIAEFDIKRVFYTTEDQYMEVL